MIALVTAMGLQVRPFAYLAVSLYTAFAVAVLVIGLNARLEREADQEHDKAVAAEQDLRRLSSRLVEAQEQERQMLSRELHDQVGQALTAIKIDVSRAAQEVPSSATEIRERLQRARQGVEETLEVIRRMSMLLRPSMLDDIGLSAALDWYARQFSANTGIKVNLNDDGTADRLPESHKASLYRIVQEALTNTARHAEAQNVKVQLDFDGKRYRVCIEDDGKGFVTGESRRGLGLLGMQERIDEMDGKLELRSRPGVGTKIWLSIPVEAAKKEAGAPVPDAEVAG